LADNSRSAVAARDVAARDVGESAELRPVRETNQSASLSDDPSRADDSAQAASATPQADSPADPFVSSLARGAESLGATRLSGSFIQTALLLGALGLAPAILLMTTCYIRIMVVLGLLRQALGTTQLPPTQVLMSLSIFLTILVMTPVWMEIKTKAFDPWSREENPISWEEAWNAGIQPLKQFMGRQIEISGNRSAVDVLYRHGRIGSAALAPEQLADAPLNVVLPAFILSELKVAFLLGFQIFLPFLILDLVVSTVTVSMGLAMLPPTMVSLPLKLILFVMVDGWNLVVGMLLQSFGGG
jgi:flagellar biosynthetic protein FliP